MNATLQFDPKTNQLTGPAGALVIAADDLMARHFLLLLQGECLGTDGIAALAQQHGYSRQRYYQLRAAFQAGGMAALQPHKTGPKTHYRRTEHVVRQVLRFRFLDPDASPAVITQKLKQLHCSISQRSVQRVIAEYGLQKKTLRAQPAKVARLLAHATLPPAGAKRGRRRP
jgi:hypothetical protein